MFKKSSISVCCFGQVFLREMLFLFLRSLFLNVHFFAPNSNTCRFHVIVDLLLYLYLKKKTLKYPLISAIFRKFLILFLCSYLNWCQICSIAMMHQRCFNARLCSIFFHTVVPPTIKLQFQLCREIPSGILMIAYFGTLYCDYSPLSLIEFQIN